MRAAASPDWVRCEHSAFAFSTLDEIAVGEVARGRKYVSAGEIYSGAHFPGAPVLPGVVIIGAVTCVAGAMLGRPNAASRVRRVRRFRFRRPVRPGDLLDIEVRRAADGAFEAVVTVADEVVASGRVELEC